MDRSFLLRKEVIDASRDFVCIRLATYEDKEEVAYLTQVFRGRAGTLENTVFAMLSPDARRYLTRAGRSPQWAFSDAADMAASMRRFAAEYKPADTSATRALPAMKDFRLALNVAACDNMPVIVAVSDDPPERRALKAKLAELAWSPALLGKAAYAPPSTTAQARAANMPLKAGIYVIEPDTFGQTGRVLARFDSGADVSALRTGIESALSKFTPARKEARSHIADGNRKGVHWKTATPVTDPQGR
jgi:hypothetical protein